jgi:hypothetical protein
MFTIPVNSIYATLEVNYGKVAQPLDVMKSLAKTGGFISKIAHIKVVSLPYI